jgi:hypothetical protein
MVVPPYLMPVYPMIAGLSVAPRAAGSLFFRGILDQSVQSGDIKPGDDKSSDCSGVFFMEYAKFPRNSGGSQLFPSLDSGPGMKLKPWGEQIWSQP